MLNANLYDLFSLIIIDSTLYILVPVEKKKSWNK